MKHFVFFEILLFLIVLNSFNIDKVEMISKEESTIGMISKEESTFAGGCFWCMEAAFQELNGVIDVISGYSGGEEENPTYEEVSSGKTRHLESIRVTYDPSKISYEKLLNIFWRQIDPTDSGGQFTDRGNQYKTAIFYHNENQRKAAEKSKKKLEKSKMSPIFSFHSVDLLFSSDNVR